MGLCITNQKLSYSFFYATIHILLHRVSASKTRNIRIECVFAQEGYHRTVPQIAKWDRWDMDHRYVGPPVFHFF